MSLSRPDEKRRAVLRKIVDETLDTIVSGRCHSHGSVFDLGRYIEFSQQHTCYISPDSSTLSNWQCHASPRATTVIFMLQISTPAAARLLSNIQDNDPADHGKTGILNFTSATKPGLIKSGRAQEESLAHSSTLFPSLMVNTAQKFYDLHMRNNARGYYSHAMIYSPKVVIFRDDDGGWPQPFHVDVLTSTAVNAGEVRKSKGGRSPGVEDAIEREMRERMGRILFLFERKGIANVVLGSFGTGIFRNNISVVAKIWADLVAVPGARFKSSFDRIVFAMGEDMFLEFKAVFNARRRSCTVRPGTPPPPSSVAAACPHILSSLKTSSTVILSSTTTSTVSKRGQLSNTVVLNQLQVGVSLDDLNASHRASLKGNASPVKTKIQRKAMAMERAQDKETHLTSDQIAALLELFEADVNKADTYLRIKDDDVRRAWVKRKLQADC